MKRFFIVTYWSVFESQTNKIHSVSYFWIWNAPVFYKWLIDERTRMEEKYNKSLVVVNCGKI